MAVTNDLAKGMCILFNGEPHIVIEKEFYSPGKGGAFTRTKLRNLKTGKIVANVFKSGERIDPITVELRTVQYMYEDGADAYFMNPTSFEQFNVSLDIIDSRTDYLHADAKYIAMIYEDAVIGIQLPPKIELVVTMTSDAVKGNTATNAYKEAELETGAKVQVPMFISNGDKIIINTETGEYTSKA